MRLHDTPLTALAVAAYIGAAYWITGSTSFANPAATLLIGWLMPRAVTAPAPNTVIKNAE